MESGRGGVGGRRPRDLIWGENGLFLHKFFTLEREWFVAAQLFALEREWFVSAQTFHHSPISQNATISAFSTAQEYRTQHEFYKSQGLIFSHKMLRNFQKQDNNCQGKYFETTDWIQYVVDCLLSMPQGLEFWPPYFHHIDSELPKVLIKVLFWAHFWGKELFCALFLVLLKVPELF